MPKGPGQVLEYAVVLRGWRTFRQTKSHTTESYGSATSADSYLIIMMKATESAEVCRMGSTALIKYLAIIPQQDYKR